MNRKFFLSLMIPLLAAASGCAGFKVPGTSFRAMDWRVESSLHSRNSTCTNLEQLNVVSSLLEEKHLNFIRSRDEKDAIKVEDILSSLGPKCKERFTKLTVPEIKTVLFGGVTIIERASDLARLGGISFEYENVSTETGIELSLHLRSHQTGPRRRLVAVYKLENERVIHFNSSGTNNVDNETRRWPIDQFFGILLGTGIALAIP